DPVAGDLHLVVEATEGGVVLQQVGVDLRRREVVHRDDGDIGARLLRRPVEVAADATEAVDADACCHLLVLLSYCGVDLAYPTRPARARANCAGSWAKPSGRATGASIHSIWISPRGRPWGSQSTTSTSSPCDRRASTCAATSKPAVSGTCSRRLAT